MGQALYRQYRSKSFGEVLGQDHIIKTLQAAVKNGRASHAYLFTGPRGVGKTSVARLLAYALNDLEYSPGSAQLDIIEIDAASNRRIDEIRDLRDRVHIAPTSLKYKVYIIDEVHMLTKEAFNALLKTLEEPPAHCIFILATTEAQKVPETISSRTQKFVFKPIGKQTIINHLDEIATSEKIAISKDALKLLAEHGGGSFRDSISMLDQLGGLNQAIDIELVRTVLGLPAQQLVNSLLISITEGDTKKVVSLLDDVAAQAVDPIDLARSLIATLREAAAQGVISAENVRLMSSLSEVAGYSSNAMQRMEVILLEAATHHTNPRIQSIAAQEPHQVVPAHTPAIESESKDSSELGDKKLEKPGFEISDWPMVLEEVKSQAASIYTALRLAEPRLEGNKLHLNFQFSLHQKKLNTTQAKSILSRIIYDTSGSDITIYCELRQKDGFEIPKSSGSSDNSQLQSISNIFGGAEVLESDKTG